jgi:cAMP phosphodiesterase
MKYFSVSFNLRVFTLLDMRESEKIKNKNLQPSAVGKKYIRHFYFYPRLRWERKKEFAVSSSQFVCTQNNFLDERGDEKKKTENTSWLMNYSEWRRKSHAIVIRQIKTFCERCTAPSYVNLAFTFHHRDNVHVA